MASNSANTDSYTLKGSKMKAHIINRILRTMENHKEYDEDLRTSLKMIGKDTSGVEHIITGHYRDVMKKKKKRNSFGGFEGYLNFKENKNVEDVFTELAKIFRVNLKVDGLTVFEKSEHLMDWEIKVEKGCDQLVTNLMSPSLHMLLKVNDSTVLSFSDNLFLEDLFGDDNAPTENDNVWKQDSVHEEKKPDQRKGAGTGVKDIRMCARTDSKTSSTSTGEEEENGLCTPPAPQRQISIPSSEEQKAPKAQSTSSAQVKTASTESTKPRLSDSDTKKNKTELIQGQASTDSSPEKNSKAIIIVDDDNDEHRRPPKKHSHNNQTTRKRKKPVIEVDERSRKRKKHEDSSSSDTDITVDYCEKKKKKKNSTKRVRNESQTKDVNERGFWIEGTDAESFLHHIDKHTADLIRDSLEIFTQNIPKIKNTFLAITSFITVLEKMLRKIPHHLDPQTNEIRVACTGCPLHCCSNWDIAATPGRPAKDSLRSSIKRKE